MHLRQTVQINPTLIGVRKHRIDFVPTMIIIKIRQMRMKQHVDLPRHEVISTSDAQADVLDERS